MDRSPRPNRTAATSSAVFSSPKLQESPFSNFLSSLSPLDTAAGINCTQGLLGINLPTPPIVFTSPHINLQRETSFLERDVIVEQGSHAVYKECNTSIVKKPSFEDAHLCSPSGYVDDFLAEPLEADSSNFDNLHLRPTKEVCRLLHSGFTSGKKSSTEIHDVVYCSTSLTSSEKAKTDRDGKETEEIARSEFKMVKESDINAYLVSGAQSCGENAANVNVGTRSAGCQFDEQKANGQSYEYPNKRKRKILSGLVKESGQNQRGIRRHLQFEAAKAYKYPMLGNSESPCSLTHDATNLRSPSIITDMKSRASSHFDDRSSSSPQAVSGTSKFPSSPYESLRSAPISVKPDTSASIHSGFGLHLNRIARPTSRPLDILSSKNSTDYLNTPRQMLEHNKTSAVSGKIYSQVTGCQQASQAGTLASSFTFHSTDSMNPPCDSLDLIQLDQDAAPCESGLSASQDSDNVEGLNQLRPERKRRKAESTSVSCKRCNCKRSKCLKLYCECFAAGVYCVGSCSCENCYNKTDFEDTVFDVRQKIESRNPLAFTPKVVENAYDSSANSKEEQNLSTPSSARHKRGCNCKKSKCLKKYCECYQANVGCSSGCRCEGCQNAFGTKADSVNNGAESWESHSAEKLDTSKGAIDCIKASRINRFSPTFEGLSDVTHLTPLSSASSSIRISAKFPQARFPSTRLQQSGCDRTDEDTPEILEETSKPPKILKSSSPNQKRVSPPQSRTWLWSTSPTGLRSGRKFILQAVPTFPPLTPYRNGKEGSNEIGKEDEATNKNNSTTRKELSEA